MGIGLERIGQCALNFPVFYERQRVVEQFNFFVLSLNNRLQHLPADVRQRRMKKIMSDLERLPDGEESHIFTPLDMLADDDWDDATENIACENAMGREKRIKQLQSFYNGSEDEATEEVEQEREHAVKVRCGKTDLHDAVLMGDCDLIRRLIADGADIHAKNNNGQTAVYLAFLEENEAVIEVFRELGIISTPANIKVAS